MTRIFLFFLLSLLLPGFCFAAPPTLEQQHPAHSFLDYSPDPADYPGPLNPLVKLIAEANALDQNKQKKTAQEKFAAAIELARQLLNKTPRGYHDSIYQLMGFAEEKSGSLNDAIKSYRTSLELKANNPVILFRHAYLLKRTGNCKEAVPEFQEVVWRTKENMHEALFFLAECLLDIGNEEEALKLSQAAYQSNPLFLPVLHQLLAMREKLLSKEKNPEEKAKLENQIRADLAAIVKQDPEDRECSLKFGQSLLKDSDPLLNSDKLKQAESLAAHFAQISKFSDEQSVKLLFDAQIRQGKLNEADKTLQQGLSRIPDSAILKKAQTQLDIERGVQASKNDGETDE